MSQPFYVNIYVRPVHIGNGVFQDKTWPGYHRFMTRDEAEKSHSIHWQLNSRVRVVLK